MSEWISAADAAKRFRVSTRRVQTLCEEQRIDGATMISGVWLIPDKTMKPKDLRIKERHSDGPNDSPETSHGVDTLTLEQVCARLSISLATGRNWVKLGKLLPSQYDGSKPLFLSAEIQGLLKDISQGKTNALKSRRNKKQAGGAILYTDYTGGDYNNRALQKVLSGLDTPLTDNDLRIVLSNFAIQFFMQSQELLYTETNLLSAFLQSRISLGVNARLIRGLLPPEFDGSCHEKLSELLSVSLHYVDGEDILGLVYSSFRNIADRKFAGAYYTPIKTVKQLVDDLCGGSIDNGKTILDPCCGTGNFLLYLGMVGSPLSQLHGYDLDEISVQLTRINMALHYRPTDLQPLYQQFICTDTLKTTVSQSYDSIVGNPPWGYAYSQEDIDYNKTHFLCGKENGTDSCDVFLERSLSLLKGGGKLAFVLPEALLNVKSHNAIRSIVASRCSFDFLNYIGNVFSGVQCPAVILGVTLGKSDERKSCKVTTQQETFYIKDARSGMPDEWTFNISDEEYACIRRIESIPDQTSLRENTKFALGIVTGNNKALVLTQRLEGTEPILKGSDLQKYCFSPAASYIRFEPEKFQQTAPAELYRAKEKLLYRFICNTLVFAYDDKQSLSLNSANIVIPSIPHLEVKYILAILNSRVAQFFTMKKFNSVKVLRAHIESIPIPMAEWSIQNEIITLVNAILNKSGVTQDIYERLDAKILGLYGMTQQDIAVIKGALRSVSLFLPD